MRAEDYNVTGVYLRGFLSGLRKISGKSYAQLLEGAGLAQFEAKYPPLSTQVVAKGSQLIKLFQLVREFLGEDGFSLFMRNLGRELAHNAATFPLFINLATNIKRETPQAEIEEWLEELISNVNRSINHDVVISTGDKPNELKISYPQCIYCAGQAPFNRPACLLVPSFYRQLILELTGISCQFDETRCGAMHGEDTCYYVLRRI